MSDQFLLELRDEVAAAARRLDARPAHDTTVGTDVEDRRGGPTGRSRWVLSAAAAVLLVGMLAAAALLLPADDPAPSAVRIEREGDRWVFRWDAPGPDPDEVRRLGEELGLDLELIERPTGEYGVGRVHGGSSDVAFDQRVRSEDDPERFDERAFGVPVDQPGAVQIYVGRLGQPGEEWDTGVPATGPGGPFACRSLLGAPLRETLAALEGTDLRVNGFDDLADSEVPSLRDPSLDQLREWEDKRVFMLGMTGPDEIWITVVDEITEPREISYPEGC